jgi:hypothetical protein
VSRGQAGFLALPPRLFDLVRIAAQLVGMLAAVAVGRWLWNT